MSEPFLAEVKIIGFNFAPRGWAFCDGQILPINQNQSLYSLLGTTYGGDGRTSFGLPDLRGRVPIHVGTGHSLGQRSGTETVVLTTQQIPPHHHAGQAADDDAGEDSPEENSPATAEENTFKASTSGIVEMGLPTKEAGSNSGHNNMQPFLTLGFCIALTGLFPSRN